MPRPGGESEKLGNRYEAVWTVDVLLDLLEGSAETLTVESLDESLGVEFDVIRPDGPREYHSVKRQTSAREWTIAALCRRAPQTGRSILGDLFDKLDRAPENRAVFVSSTGANWLSGLCEQAGRSSDLGEFRKRIWAGRTGKERLDHDCSAAEFENRITQLADGSEERAFEYLRRLEVSLIDEPQLIRRVEQRIDARVCLNDGSAADPRATRLLLAETVLKNLGTPLTSDKVREGIAASHMLRDWAREPSVRKAISRINDTYCRQVEAELINGSQIEQSESQEAFSILTASDGPRVTILVAPAGYGKSCVVVQTVRLIHQAKIPCLCLRLDSYPEAVSLRDWGQKLDVHAAPHVVLQNVARGRPSVLVVDQLDAMSIVSGRSPALWDLFEQMLSDVRSYPRMRILVACREYDLQNDHRLLRIAADQALSKRVVISRLDIVQVKDAIMKSGLDTHALRDKQLELLRIPYHLSLFLETLPEEAPTFQDIGELYGRYWDHKRRKVGERLKRDANWLPVVDAITQYLSQRQVLSAPRRIVDQWEDDVHAMVSEHVLISEDKNVRFFAECFFDYAYARRFVDSGGDLLEMLLGSEQHLFRRAQVRQVLTYARRNDPQRYLECLQSVLFHPEVRFHVKKVVISGLSQCEDPSQEEWAIVQKALSDSSLQAHAYVAIRGNFAWFDLLDHLGLWTEWLASSDDSHVDRACWLLTAPSILEERSSSLAELLRPYVATSEAWDKRLRYVMSWGQAHRSREMFQIFLDLIRDGTVDESHGGFGSEWWMMLYKAPEENPTYAAEAIGCWLERRLSMISDSDEGNPFDDLRGSQVADRIILKAAESAPEEFVGRVLSPVARLVERTALPEDEGTVRDRVWTYRSYGYHHSIDSAILVGLKGALEWMAGHCPERLHRETAPLEGNVYDTIEFLLVSAWSANPERYAEKCGQYILQHTHRLEIGYSSWSDGNGQAAVTRLAIERITAHCSAELLESIENAIIGFVRPWERRSVRERGFFEYLLLQSIHQARRSRRVLNRIEELSHKFQQVDTSLPTRDTFEVRFAGSPIPPERTKLMSDVQWIRAMRRYASESHQARDWPKGGARELAHILEMDTRRDRHRFASLTLRMEDDINPAYFSAILQGLCACGASSLPEEESEKDKADLESFPTDVLADAIRRLHSLPRKACGMAICRGIRSLAQRPWPDDLLQIVAWYAKSDPDPEEELWQPDADGGEPCYGGDPESHGINTVRGAAAEAIALLLFADMNRLPRLIGAIDSLVRDQSLAVRSSAIDTLLPLLNSDRDRAVSLFLKLAENASLIYGTNNFEEFIHYAAQTHYVRLRHLLLRALNSPNEKAVAAAGRQICLAAFRAEIAEEDANRVRTGSVQMRKAAAEVYGRNFKNPSLSSECSTYLRDLFHDADREVLDIAARCFWHVDGDSLLANEELVKEFVHSPAFNARSEDFLHALSDSVARLPDIVCRAAERMIEEIGAKGSDISLAASMSASTLATLVVRLYGQTEDEKVKTKCLDLIDRMEELSYYGIDRELAALER